MKAFISYAHEDERYVERLLKHMVTLEREGSITSFYDRMITAGSPLDDSILRELESCGLFLAIVSPDFIASGYCFENELKRAFELQDAGKLRVVSVVVEPCDWLETPLSKYLVVPKDGQAVALWDNQNMAFLNVISSLRSIAEEMSEMPTEEVGQTGQPIEKQATTKPRYVSKRTFDQIDQIKFKELGYKTVREYFERSAMELSETEGLSAIYRKIDEFAFTCTVLNESFGRGVASITVRMGTTGGSSFGDLYWSEGENSPSNSANGWCSISSNDYAQYFKIQGGMNFLPEHSNQYSPDGVAKFLWDGLLSRAGISYA